MASRPQMEEHGAFSADPSLPDNSADMMEIFRLSGDVGTSANPDDAGDGGTAPAQTPASAAEGGEGQQQPTTPPASPQGADVAPTPQPQPAPQAPAPVATPTPAVPTPAPQPSADMQALQAQVQALTQLLAQQQQSGAQDPTTGQPAQQQPQAPTPEQLLDYSSLAIPQNVTEAIFGEDPRVAAQGLNHLITSFGKVVHTRVMQHVDQIVEQRLTERLTQEHQSSEQQRMQNEYYGEFPDHNDPGIRLVVSQEAQRIWTENPALSWDANARRALGAAVNARLGRAAPTPQPGAQPAPAPTPAPRPAAMTGASTRPATPEGNDENFIDNILGAL